MLAPRACHHAGHTGAEIIGFPQHAITLSVEHQDVQPRPVAKCPQRLHEDMVFAWHGAVIAGIGRLHGVHRRVALHEHDPRAAVPGPSLKVFPVLFDHGDKPSMPTMPIRDRRMIV